MSKYTVGTQKLVHFLTCLGNQLLGLFSKIDFRFSHQTPKSWNARAIPCHPFPVLFQERPFVAEAPIAMCSRVAAGRFSSAVNKTTNNRYAVLRNNEVNLEPVWLWVKDAKIVAEWGRFFIKACTFGLEHWILWRGHYLLWNWALIPKVAWEKETTFFWVSAIQEVSRFFALQV